MDSILRIMEKPNRTMKRQDFLSEEQFRALVLYECARCDRNHHQFSLIQVELQNPAKSKQNRQLIKRVLKRIRGTDEAGWLNDDSFGIFLPETNQEGARKLAPDICGNFAYQIYTYPWITSDLSNDASRGCGTGDGKIPRDYTRPEGEHLGETSKAVDSDGEQAPLNCREVEELVLPKELPLWKRTFDIVGASLLLIGLFPLFLLVALYIKSVSRGPVFFKQQRIGYLGRPFTIWKFRTMIVDNDNISVHKDYLKKLIKEDCNVMTKLDTGKDNRLIPMAGLLRRSCIDELPQIFNVLKGDMSLVGPRPCLAYEAEGLKHWHHKRFHAFPGLTGLWQVSGKNRLSFREMMRLDVRYAIRRNPALDILISMKTIPAIVEQVRDAMTKKISFPRERGGEVQKVHSPARILRRSIPDSDSPLRKFWTFFL